VSAAAFRNLLTVPPEPVEGLVMVA